MNTFNNQVVSRKTTDLIMKLLSAGNNRNLEVSWSFLGKRNTSKWFLSPQLTVEKILEEELRKVE